MKLSLEILNEKKIWILLALLVISQLTLGVALQADLDIEKTRLDSIEPNQTLGPTITNIVQDITEPTPTQAVEISADINDEFGLQNATLYYRYTTIGGSLNSTDMVSTPSEEKADDFNKTVHLDPANGFRTDMETEIRVGTYFVDNIAFDSLTINAISAGNRGFVNYYSIEVKSAIDSGWTSVETMGDPLGSIDLEPVTTSYNQTFFGLNITAVTNATGETGGNDGSKYPTLDADLFQSANLYVGSIPAANEPTFVTYYIEAFSNDNNSTRTADFTYLLDNDPEIAINEVSRSITGSDPIFVNVTVTDIDGIDTVPNGNVYAEYRAVGSANWTLLPLTKAPTLSSISANFEGSAQVGNIGEGEATFEMIITAIDTVGGVNGRNVTVDPGSITIDTVGPEVTDLQFIGPNVFNNITNFNETVTLEVQFSDFAGIQSASIHYSKTEDGTFIELAMQNLTNTEQGVTPITFNVTLPAAGEDTPIYYYIESTDFFNNTATTPLWFYYADGLGPIILDADIVFDSVVGANFGNTIVFNATDTTEIDDTLSFGRYSQDNINWVQTSISVIDYNNVQTNYDQTFSRADLPAFIQNNAQSTYNLSVTRLGNVQLANLRIDFTHQNSFDLRMWLLTEDGLQFLIFDRLTDVKRIDLDLLELGLIEEDFDSTNFTLLIEDKTEMFTGTLDRFEITLLEYEIPYAYQFRIDIPEALNDTDVSFSIELYDKVGNAINSTIFTYYSDAGPPVIELIPLDSPV
ncbi:MAG: hypothetical protein IH840_07045, partial [Candidatus Heimdallarchaeota archaeon]|nr:hypothetical protein [Candidatus Heimdallarchaeota archaeon]